MMMSILFNILLSFFTGVILGAVIVLAIYDIYMEKENNEQK